MAMFFHWRRKEAWLMGRMRMSPSEEGRWSPVRAPWGAGVNR